MIPLEILDWFRDIFADVNRRVSEKILNVPSIHETHLDTTFIEHLLGYASPRKFKSKWLVRIDTHYIGGLRHFRTWEVADIGVFVFFQQQGNLLRQKVALLQSKRLHPKAGDIEHIEAFDYMLGMARIADRDMNSSALLAARTFDFVEKCQYKALVSGDEQHKAIAAYFDQYEVPIFYLLYNPPQVPLKIHVPLAANKVLQAPPILGARVLPMEQMFSLLETGGKGYSPTLASTKNLMPPGAGRPYGWRLEYFMTDLLLGCTEGRRVTREDKQTLEALFHRRSGPIAAAIAVTIEVPEGVTLPD